jgi:hypothetical protein
MMKRLLLTALLASVSLGAGAQTSPTTSVEVRGYPVEAPTQTYRLFRSELDAYKGAYDLSNGQGMVIRQAGQRIYADVGNLPTKELVAIARGVFVSNDRSLKMNLVKDGVTAEITGTVMMRVADTSIAQTGGGGGAWVSLVAAK